MLLGRKRPSPYRITDIPQLWLTEQARGVLEQANEEARHLKHDFVGTEHILLAILASPNAVCTAVLNEFGIAPEQVRHSVLAAVRPGPAPVDAVSLPYTSRSRDVLNHAKALAQQVNHTSIFPEHLLLGCQQEGTGVAAEVLGRLGVRMERALELVVEKHSSASPKAADFYIDDSSSVSIFDQLVRQIQEAIATQRLLSGDRLPSVRKLADQLDVAPGTVARVYRALEHSGILVTEGARGTRVRDTGAATTPRTERLDELVELLRPAAVSAFHLGASAAEVRSALEVAMRDIFSAE